MECAADANSKHCTCTYTACSRRGKCCLCVTYHQKNGEIPGCFFSKEGEARYDRSLAAFRRDLEGRC